jgi:hypothetical protein
VPKPANSLVRFARWSGLVSTFTRTEEIRQERPDWNLFRDDCPAGETLDAVSARADWPERAGIRSVDFYRQPQSLEAEFHDGSVIH